MEKVIVAVCLALLLAVGCEAKQSEPQVPASGPSDSAKPSEEQSKIAAGARKSLEKGLEYLFSHQKEDGSIITDEPGADAAALGATTLTVNGAARAPKDIRAKYEDRMAKACQYILKKRMSDGSFQGKEGLPTYTTALAIMALHNTDSQKYSDAIRKGQEYLIKAQYHSEVSPDDVNYGGWTYGEDSKGKGESANMSTTHYAMMALDETKLAKDNDVFKRAVVYLQRSQNNSETNDVKVKGVKVLSDGGFIYGPGMTRASKDKKGLVDENNNAYFPSYASMTYAGFKSLLYANLPKDDPRVLAALSWIKENYTLDRNTGMGYRADEKSMDQQGIYYFYNAFARAMDAWGEKEIEDASGAKHIWAVELTGKLMEKQLDDGSWMNPEDRWHEGLKSVVTGYCLDALGTCIRWLER